MVGTIEQALEARDQRNAHDLSDFDLKMIGTFVRLEIPMTDISKLRQVPALLREFASRIDEKTRRSDLPIRSILLELKMDASLTATRIKELSPEVFKKRWIG